MQLGSVVYVKDQLDLIPAMIVKTMRKHLCINGDTIRHFGSMAGMMERV